MLSETANQVINLGTYSIMYLPDKATGQWHALYKLLVKISSPCAYQSLNNYLIYLFIRLILYFDKPCLYYLLSYFTKLSYCSANFKWFQYNK